MKKYCLLGLFLILITIAAQAVFSQGGNYNQTTPPNRSGMSQMRMVTGVFATMSPMQVIMIAGQNRQLNLSQEQRSFLNQLQTAYAKDLNTAPTDSKNELSPAQMLEKTNKELREALLTKDVSAETIKNKIKACRDAEDIVNSINLKYWAEIRNALNEDQLKKLNEVMSARPLRTGGNNFGGPQNRQNRQNRQNTENRDTADE